MTYIKLNRILGIFFVTIIVLTSYTPFLQGKSEAYVNKKSTFQNLTIGGLPNNNKPNLGINCEPPTLVFPDESLTAYHMLEAVHNEGNYGNGITIIIIDPMPIDTRNTHLSNVNKNKCVLINESGELVDKNNDGIIEYPYEDNDILTYPVFKNIQGIVFKVACRPQYIV